MCNAFGVEFVAHLGQWVEAVWQGRLPTPTPALPRKGGRVGWGCPGRGIILLTTDFPTSATNLTPEALHSTAKGRAPHPGSADRPPRPRASVRYAGGVAQHSEG